MEPEDNMSVRVASFSCYLDTAKDNLVHRVSAQDTPIALSSGRTNSPSIKPPFSIKFSKPKDSSQDSLTNLRVDSFSYLNNSTAGDNFVFEVPGPIQDPTCAFSFSQEFPKDSEISVFGADKYFNMKLEYQTEARQQHSYKKEGPVKLPQIGSNTKPRAPSLHSEASSCNSQLPLIPDLRSSGSQTRHKKAIGKKIFTGFGCKGPCFQKKAVHINELVAQGTYHGHKPTRTRSERIDHLAQTHAPNPGSDQNSVAKQQLDVQLLDESRHSIEVFGSGTTSKGSDIATNMERKLSMLTWDAIPKGQALPTSTLGSSTVCDDMASEASSDLFEIDNISGSIYPVLTSEPGDDVSTCMMSPTSHYAPSEASIQWSVVTASAADCSMLSDYNDETSVSIAGDVITRNNDAANRTTTKTRSSGGSREAQKSRPGGLLGCKSQKSVDVAENVCHKTNEKAKNQGLDLSVPFGKSQVAGRGLLCDDADSCSWGQKSINVANNVAF